MKQLPLAFLFTLFCIQLFAQQQDDPFTQPYQIDKDTMYAMVDETGKIKNLPGMPFIRKYWPENGKYRELLFAAEKGTLVRAAWFKDKDCSEKDGSWEEFHHNGLPKDSGRYENNLKQGTFRGWYENGAEHHILHYNNGIPIDTGYVFMENGNLLQLTITDESGTGIEQNYFENGKVRMLGRIKEGKKNGLWTLKREDGSKKMNMNFVMDSIVQTTCYETDGKTHAIGDCVFEREAASPNGKTGLQDFLKRNLEYPGGALDRRIQGVVSLQFTVNKDGTISDFVIISSPDKMLSDEVLRLMKKSPKWIPAIQYGEPVVYKHVQAFTFRMN